MAGMVLQRDLVSPQTPLHDNRRQLADGSVVVDLQSQQLPQQRALLPHVIVVGNPEGPLLAPP